MTALLLVIRVLLVVASSSSALALSSSSARFPPSASSNIKVDGVVVDCENVRGKSGFAASHTELVDSLVKWSSARTTSKMLWGKMTLVVDHGSESSSFWVSDSDDDDKDGDDGGGKGGRGGMAVTFSGPHCTADDIIVYDTLPYYNSNLAHPQRQQQDGDDEEGQQQDGVVYLVTADRELIRRCYKVLPQRGRLRIVPPIRLLEELEKTVVAATAFVAGEPGATTTMTSTEQRAQDKDTATKEVRIACEMLEAHALLKAVKSRKRKNSLKHKIHKLRKLLLLQQQQQRSGQEDGDGAVVVTMLDRVENVMKNHANSEGSSSSTVDEIDSTLSKQYAESLRAAALRRGRLQAHKETTSERIVLAEQLRLKLLDTYGHFEPHLRISTTVAPPPVPPALAYLHWRNQRPDMKQSSSASSNNIMGRPDGRRIGPLRLVVLSDTHGFHRQLGERLPDGDVLIHLGDFSSSSEPSASSSPPPSSIRTGLEKHEEPCDFDLWLSNQPHPRKIILRGKCDPKRKAFVHSQALYVTQPDTIDLSGYALGVVPFQGRGLSNRSIPKSPCDILTSHAPPAGYLDRCSKTGQSVGSQVLRRALEGGNSRQRGLPLMLCGHVHECRGVLRTLLDSNIRKDHRQETLLINAANAGSGASSGLLHGPVVLELEQGRRKRQFDVNIVEMENRYEFLNHLEREFFSLDTVDGEKDRQGLLVAVDMGLRTGISLYDNHGQLLRFADFHFDCLDDLEKYAPQLLLKWEIEAGRRITHMAVEGTDPPIERVWRDLADRSRLRFLNVPPDDWRADLLSSVERRSGDTSKSTSLLKAQRLVNSFGDTDVLALADELGTDASESIMLGLHVSRRLGWVGDVSENPAVKIVV